jgi:acyl carrier protein
MNRKEILDEIVTVIKATNPNIKVANISEDTMLGEFELDSIKLVELSVRIEELFGGKVELDTWVDEGADGGYSNLTIGSLASFIESRI